MVYFIHVLITMDDYLFLFRENRAEEDNDHWVGFYPDESGRVWWRCSDYLSLHCGHI